MDDKLSLSANTVPRFHNKVAICTASTSGIGLAVAQRIAQEGGKVVISSRKQENVDKAVETLKKQGLEVSGIVAHQGKHEDRERLVQYTLDRYGAIDVLLCNAGVNPHQGIITSISEESFDKIYSTNIKATFMMIRLCVPHMIKRGGGSIVTNATVAALYPEVASLYVGHYAVSKLGVISLTRVLASELAQHNIRVNCIAPGPIKTKFLEGMYRDFYPPEMKKVPKLVLNHVLLKRAGTPDECAAPITFFLSDEASYITGETIPVSGGNLRSRL